MAPRQNTFTLVPNPLGMQGLMSRPANANTTGPPSRPPMTSKQAQKLYKQANRQPRMTKAEQRALERQEQERIRQELDKEKQASKARTLREKKKAKEQQALQEKKRKGLPLVNVRPSQDTIARFVRGNGLGKKRDSVGAKVDLPPLEEEVEDDTSHTEDGLDMEDRVPLEEAARASQCKRQRVMAQDTPALCPRARNSTLEADLMQEWTDIAKNTQGKEKREPKSTTTIMESPRGKEITKPIPIPTKAISTFGTEGLGGKERNQPISTPSGTKATAIAEIPLGKNKQQSVLTPKAPAQRQQAMPSENTIPTIPPRVVDNTIPVAAPTRAPTIPTKATQEPANPFIPQATRPVKSHHKTQVAPKPQTPWPGPRPTKLPPVPQRLPTPQVTPAQHHISRKVLQETTNTSNRARPVTPADSASKHSTPYKATLPGSRISQPSPIVPAFRQPRPGARAGAVQRPKFLPPHLRPPTSRPLLLGHVTPVPPTSTQLFVMSHIDDDDLFPTLSQGVRELQGEPPAAVAKPPEPSRPPIAAFATKPPFRSRQPTRQLTRQVAHINSMAPPPRQATHINPMVPPSRAAAVKPAEAPILPFISTQDLAFSSQDLREMETLTPGKAKGSGSRPPFLDMRNRVRQESPSFPSTSAAQQAAGFRTKRPSQPPKHPVPARITTPKQDPGVNPCPQAQKHISVPKGKETTRPNRPERCSVASNPPDKPDDSRAVTIPRSPSPERRRFFGSSGHGLELLAIERSRKSYQEEERRRAQQDQNRSEAKPTDRVEDEQRKHPERRGEQRQPLPQQQASQPRINLTRAASQHKTVSGGQPETCVPTTSQGTDYGDAELDALDIQEFGLDY